MKFRNLFIVPFAALLLGTSGESHADTIGQRRQAGEAALREYANKQYDVSATFIDGWDPAKLSKGLGVQLLGCPSAPISEPSESINLTFFSGRLGPWAGDLDGVNIKLVTDLGEEGYALATPSNVSGDRTRLQINFDQSLNIERATIDRIAKEIDKCFSKLPVGEFSPEKVLEGCKIPVVEKEQVGQTCVLITTGNLTASSLREDFFDAEINVTTMCDFVGMGAAANRNTGFTSCYSYGYKGTATMSSKNSMTSAGLSLRKQVAQSYRRCNKKRGMKGRVACTIRGLDRQ